MRDREKRYIIQDYIKSFYIKEFGDCNESELATQIESGLVDLVYTTSPDNTSDWYVLLNCQDVDDLELIYQIGEKIIEEEKIEIDDLYHLDFDDLMSTF